MFHQPIIQSDILYGCALIVAVGCLAMTDIWTDETEVNYRKWHKERYGEEPPEVNLSEILLTRRQQAVIHKIDNDILNITQKEESMKKDKIPEGFHEHAVGIHEDHEESSGGVADSMEEKASLTISGDGALSGYSQSKRTRRPKGLPDNVTVETYQEATIHVYVPARPEGMKKVTIAIHSHYDNDIFIDWPEGVTDMEALTIHFVVEATKGE